MMKTPKLLIGLALTLVVGGAVLVVACDDSGSAVKENPVQPTGDGAASPGIDAAGPGADGSAGVDGGPSDCVQNPHTHDEIINACTDAVKITKNPTLPLLLPDGGLPPL
jgi:hypothetical protein